MRPRDSDIPADLRPVAERLRAERAAPTALELDDIKQKVLKTSSATGRNNDMRSRLAVLTMLVLGLVFGTAGAGVAVNGLSGNDQASTAQYGDVSPETDTGNDNGDLVGGETDTDTGNGAANEAVQPAEQTAAQGGSTLPFTGFAAIPLLLLGIGLFGGGLLLRRTSRAR